MKRNNIWMHVAAWAALYIVWIMLFQNHAFAFKRTMTVEFCYLLFITADYYFINGFINPRFLARKRYGYFIALVLAAVFVSAWLRALVALQMNRYYFHQPSLPGFDTLLLNSIINISIWTLLLISGKMLFDRRQTQKQLEVLEQERLRNELDYLKAQINPHSFFNSINTIYGNIDKTNDKARTILLQFSELLRYQLYECHAERVCLEKELAYLKNYIAFQRLRKDENLKVRLILQDVEQGLNIAPLLLVVLIENAFKFVSNSFEKENEIWIKIYLTNAALTCNVYNTKEGQLRTKDATGIGLTNLKRRLELLYPQKHHLHTHATSDYYDTTLTVQLK